MYPIHSGRHIIFRNVSFCVCVCAKVHVQYKVFLFCVCLCMCVCLLRTTFHSICTGERSDAAIHAAQFQRTSAPFRISPYRVCVCICARQQEERAHRNDERERTFAGRHYMHKECFNLLMPTSARRPPVLALVLDIILCV